MPPSAVGPPGTTNGPHNDDITFGAGASGHGGWNQFSVNEKLFGVKTGFDEDLYTTKLDRSAPDYAEREKRAQALANEIMRVRPLFTHFYSVFTGATQGATSNPHILEERVMNNVDNSGTNEEDKYITRLSQFPVAVVDLIPQVWGCCSWPQCLCSTWSAQESLFGCASCRRDAGCSAACI